MVLKSVAEGSTEAPEANQLATLHRRPSCVFCLRLCFSLWWHRLSVQRMNIWIDHDAAASVQSAANGNETIGTVVIDGPSWDQDAPCPAATRPAAIRLAPTVNSATSPCDLLTILLLQPGSQLQAVDCQVVLGPVDGRDHHADSGLDDFAVSGAEPGPELQ